MDFQSLIERKRARFEELEREIADPALFENRKRASELLRLRCGLSHTVDAVGHQNRHLRRLPSIFHRRTKIRRYRGPGGEVYPPLRRYQGDPRPKSLAKSAYQTVTSNAFEVAVFVYGLPEFD